MNAVILLSSVFTVRRPIRSGGKTGAQLSGGQATGVGRAAQLVFASVLGERAGVDRIEADLVDQLLGHRALRLFVIA